MRTALMVAITIGMPISPAAAQSKGEGKARVETQEQCEARQQKIRDPVSGIRIQACDAARFCYRQRSKR